MSVDDLRLLTLHGLRLAGLATTGSAAEIHDLDPCLVGEQLERLRIEGLVAPARGDGGRWVLTESGRSHGEDLLARELDAVSIDDGASGRAVVTSAYRRFLHLNQQMLAVCTDWQIVDRDPVVLNDHQNPARDSVVIAALGEIDDRIAPVCAELEAVLTRFGRYRSGFTEALRRLGRGETDWLTKPTILSYHTLWFQLHEDLLATLGLERAAETARLNSEPTIERPQGKPEANPGMRPEPRSGRPSSAQPGHPDSPLTESPKDSS